VLPIHAFSYVLNAILAVWILGEQMPLLRWVSTGLITLGVLLVGLGENQTSRLAQPQKLIKKTRHFPAFIAPLGWAISKSWLAILIIAIADASGDVLLALGMKQAGRVERSSRRDAIALMRRVIVNPAIMGGILCQTIAFTSFITVLSWADISFVRPGTALTYIFSLIGAKYLLKETITREKLMGIILVGLGIAIHH
jgi:drug/metabolite transporter (DMT)-like permease